MAKKSLNEILGGVTRFGRLVVIGEAVTKGKYRRAECLCDCGSKVQPFTFSLTSGSTLSCGCLHKARAKARAAVVGKANKKHGRHGSAEYNAWRSAIDRCERISHPAYQRYGGRGILVAPEWRDSFEAFYRDMGARPKGGTLERIDNSCGYEPGNCEWRGWKDQNRNRRNTVFVEWRGRTVPL